MSDKENAQQTEENPINISNIFNKRQAVVVDESKSAPAKEPSQKEEAPKKEVVKKEESVEKPTTEAKEDTAEKTKEAETTNEVDYKAEYEKQLKIIKDTQKSYHENNKKLALYTKAVNKMKEEGTLLEDEATLLLDHARYEDVPEDEPQLVKYGKIWDKEIEYMRKYAPNPKEIDQNIRAFQHFMQNAPTQEIEDALSELAQYEEDEVEFTRQMLEIGRQYNDDIYSDIHEAGSIRNLKSKYSERIAELEKKLDKKEKEYNKLKEKYEDYDANPANLNLPTGSGSHNPPDASFDISKIFSKRYQNKLGY